MSQPRLRAALLIAGAGAVVVLVDVLGRAGAFGGLAAIVLGLVLSTGGDSRRADAGPDWRRLLAVGSALVAVGVPLGIVLETPGGLLAAVGAALVVVAVALGLP